MNGDWSSIFGNISSEEHQLILDIMINTQYEYQIEDDRKLLKIDIEEYTDE